MISSSSKKKTNELNKERKKEIKKERWKEKERTSVDQNRVTTYIGYLVAENFTKKRPWLTNQTSKQKRQ